jgi:hypothetical protein
MFPFLVNVNPRSRCTIRLLNASGCFDYGNKSRLTRYIFREEHNDMHIMHLTAVFTFQRIRERGNENVKPNSFYDASTHISAINRCVNVSSSNIDLSIFVRVSLSDCGEQATNNDRRNKFKRRCLVKCDRKIFICAVLAHSTWVKEGLARDCRAFKS